MLKTSPRKAIEGARDTVVLEVKQCIKGKLKKKEIIKIYYHLLWEDTEEWILEDPKFLLGKDYLVFTTTSVRHETVNRTEYKLTDRWLSVQKPHPTLIKEIRERKQNKAIDSDKK